ncbi:MAG: flagellar basal body protein [Rhodoferax sp.]|nr:flagellar basal body protein [Rhodoferax sp.]
MNSLPSIAVSGMQAAQSALRVSSHNVANLNTPGFRRQELSQRALEGGGVTTQLQRAEKEGAALETDLIAQLQAKNAFLANLAVFRTADKLAGTLLDERV